MALDQGASLASHQGAKGSGTPQGLPPHFQEGGHFLFLLLLLICVSLGKTHVGVSWMGAKC